MKKPSREQTEAAIRRMGPIDGDIAKAMSEGIEEGWIEIVGVGEDGELSFRLTEAGKARAETLIRGLTPDFDGED